MACSFLPGGVAAVALRWSNLRLPSQNLHELVCERGDDEDWPEIELASRDRGMSEGRRRRSVWGERTIAALASNRRRSHTNDLDGMNSGGNAI